MGLLLSLFLGFAPMLLFAYIVYWVDRYEKEPLVLLGLVFLWGTVVASGAAFLVNTLLGAGIYFMTGSETATDLTTGALIAPIVEECLKGFAILVIFLLFQSEFDSILDGIIYASITALGFAATENAYYIFTYGYLKHGLSGLLMLTFVRVVLVGWQHPFYTAFTGIGLAVSRLSRRPGVRLAAPLAGLALAILTHSVHNTLADTLDGVSGLATGTLFDWTGWLFMGLFVLWALRREQQWIQKHLREELELGLITPAQYRTACSSWSQVGARLGALFNGRYQVTRQFYQVCAELAYKKQQRSALGEEHHNSQIISTLRADLSRLSPIVSSGAG